MKQSLSIQGLSAAGLEKREAQLIDALSSGEAFTVSGLARAVNLNRPAVYTHLETLIEKGLITEVKEQKRVLYQFAGMDALNAWRASQDDAYAQYVDELSAQGKVPTLPDDVRIYRGKDISKVWEMVLERTPKGGVFYRYDGYSPDNPVTSYMPKDYYEMIDKKQLERFVITNDGLRQAPYKKKIVCASRMLPKKFDDFEQGVTQFIFKDTVAMIDLNTEVAYVIHNAAIAAYHARVFYFLFTELPE